MLRRDDEGQPLELAESTDREKKVAAAKRLAAVEKEYQAAQRAIQRDSQNNANRERLRRAREEYAKAEAEASRLLGWGAA